MGSDWRETFSSKEKQLEQLSTVLFDSRSPLTEEQKIVQERDSKKIKFPPGLATKATEGDATAQLEVGKIFSTASSLEKNCDLAFDWLSRSAEQGNMEAQFRLGDIYALGHGTSKSLSDAYKWYTEAAIQGYKKALIRIHNLYQEDIKMHSRGQINSGEEEWASEKFKKENKIRELYEYRLQQKKDILNGAMDYYNSQFKHYQSSKQDNPAVQLNLAFLYQHGYGVRKCTRWAFEYYTLAAEQGDVNAQYNLGGLYQKHTSMKFNYRQAFKWYTQSAQGGHMAAQRSLGYFYLQGLATNIDYDAALYWYNKAAEVGDSEAQMTLGKLYRKGDYLKQDLPMAVKWYSLAARQGNIVAQNCLSQLHQRGKLDSIQLEQDMSEYVTENFMKSRQCTKLSVDISKFGDSPKFKQLNELGRRALIGDGQAMYEIGLMYLNGDNGFNRDQYTGIKWIKNAAYAKHKHAQVMIADLCKKGDSIEQDYHKATIWYQSLAKQKDASAQCNIGIMYNEGLGVRRDPLEASKWFIWAEDQGNSDAQYNLGCLRLEGKGLRQDEDEAVNWFYKSAQQKNIYGCYRLGEIYVEGQYQVEKDSTRGLKLMEFAANNGSTQAQLEMARRFEMRVGVNKSTEKSIKYYTMAADVGSPKAQFQLAITYLKENCVPYNYIEAYILLRQAKDQGYVDAERMFQSPFEYDSIIDGYFKVTDLFVEVTKNGIDDLSYYIGYIFEYGMGVHTPEYAETSYKIAETWYSVASDNGDSRADYRLGMMRENGRGASIDLNTAIYYYIKAASKGNTDAIYRLAFMYYCGYGVPQDFLEAFKHYTEASVLGHQKAREALMIFEDNRELRSSFANRHSEVQVTDKVNVNMLEKATEGGYTRLQYQIGVWYQNNENYRNAFTWLRRAVDLGVTDAYYRLGTFYEEGQEVEQDYEEAANLYQKAADKEHKDACYRLGQLYQYGNGVNLDYLIAYKFYKKAADMGHEAAQEVLNITLDNKIESNSFFNPSSPKYQDSLLMCRYVAEHGDSEVQFQVGFAYEHCIDTPDCAEAFKWYSMAAEKSHREAMYHLGLLYEKGSGVSRNYQNAYQLLYRAGELRNGDALYQLGKAFHHGKDIGFDPTKAVEYYTLAAELGNPKYQCSLGKLYEEGELVQKDLLEALRWYTKAYLQGYNGVSSKLYAMYQDESYKLFFYDRLFRILSVATCGYFRLNKSYNIDDFGGVNNRIGSLFVFGYGVEKNLNIAWDYFSKKYDNHPELNISNFFILNQRSLSTSQLRSILLAFEDNEAFMNQLSKEEIYNLGMIYYDGVVQTQSIEKKNKLESYTPTGDPDNDDPNQYFLLQKDHSRAFTYLTKAADKSYNKALLQLKTMCRHGYGASENSVQGHAYSDCAEELNIKDIGYLAMVYHTHERVQNFSTALQWYRQLKSKMDKYLVYNDRKIINQQVYLGLGLLYEYGDGVRQDFEEALRCYKVLMGYNRALGLHRLGLMYYHGKGVSVNYDESFKLFEEASHGGTWTGENVVFVYDKYDFLENPSQSNLVYSIMDRQQVAGENHFYLGLVHKNGQGTPLDNVKAQYHFKMAFVKGCKRAEYEIED